MKPPLISVLLHTASRDDFLGAQGIASAFQLVVDCLVNQSFVELELVYVDAYHDQNRESFAAVPAPFVVKHVPVHPEHRYWYDKGHIYICAAKNTGILYADGELLVCCDDAEIFPPQLLGLYWRHFKTGHFLHALHKRYRKVLTVEGRLRFPIEGDEYVSDSRWRYVSKVHPHDRGDWMNAACSFSLRSALAVNGFDERFDGDKGLEDCDFGQRLVRHGGWIIADPDAYIWILDHENYLDAATARPGHRPISYLVAVSCWGTMNANTRFGVVVANQGPTPPEHYPIIRRETLKHRRFDPLAPENQASLALWKAVPTFDLRAQRRTLRASSDWRWG